MLFIGIQQTVTYSQINQGGVKTVFPLLCPVREKEWLDGWDYRMIHSQSGLIEQGCVFNTPHHGALETTWYVSQYDPLNYCIEFIRITPEEMVVHITIQLECISEQQTKAIIIYQYTALNEEQNRWIETELQSSFVESMKWWEKAINHYLQTGMLLKKY